jgi:hypothetical protein
MRHFLLLASSLLPILASSARGAEPVFDPYAFEQQVAICPGINRAENKTVDLNLGMLSESHETVFLI